MRYPSGGERRHRHVETMELEVRAYTKNEEGGREKERRDEAEEETE